MIMDKKFPRLAAFGAVLAACGALLLGGLSLAQQPAAPPQVLAVAGGPLTMRRLTELQYRASIADIFGGDIAIAGRFERGLRADRLLAVGASQAGISPFSFEQYDAMARSIAAQVVDEQRRGRLVGCAPASAARFDNSCATRFVEDYGLRLFRRPLSRQERAGYLASARAAQRRLGDFYAGLEFALASMLVAPDFLFRIERSEPDGAGGLRVDAYSKVTRLAYFLTNSTPDEELLRATQSGELDTEAGLARQVDRLIASPRFEQALRAFFADMLQFDVFADLSKDPVIYPAFNANVALDAQEQTLRTIADHLIARRGDYRDLFTTRRTFLTRALGVVYRLPVPTRNGFQSAEYPESAARAGILTDISFLALHSHPGRSSPTIRGKSIREIFLCQTIPPPPPNVDFSVVQDPSNTAMPTARERLDAHRIQPGCSSCHRLMDPIGLPLENFDGLGAFRARENGATIDPSGVLDGRAFDTPAGLGQALHDHPQTPRCLVGNMVRAGLGRATLPGERAWTDQLNSVFAAEGYRVPELMRAIATSRAFYAVAAPASASSNGGNS